MAIYRNVQLSFWTDNKVEDDFTPEDKYFYIYLLTNPQTNICGCYEVSYSQMTRQTGYNKDTIIRLLERFDKVHKVIKFDSETKEMHKANTPEDKEHKMKALDGYIKELGGDITQLIGDMTAEERNLMRTKLSTLVSKL
jgi:hypothetical protein